MGSGEKEGGVTKCTFQSKLKIQSQQKENNPDTCIYVAKADFFYFSDRSLKRTAMR